MPMLPGGRMPAVVDRAIVSTGPDGPLDGTTLSLADGDADPDADAAADAVARALDDGARDSAGDPAAHPASKKATAATSTFALVTRRS